MADASPRWLDEWFGAVDRNIRVLQTWPGGPGVVESARGLQVFSTKRVARWIRERLPYRFDGAQHRISDLYESEQRGYWACADGSALASAAFILAGTRDVHLCDETVQGLDGYAHARAVVGRRFVEPWPDHRRPEARSCSMLVDVLGALRA